MKLLELQEDEPIAWTLLRKLVVGGKTVILVKLSSSGHTVFGHIPAIFEDPMPNGEMIYKVCYRTNDTFMNNYGRDQVEKAQIKRIPELKATRGELCFIVPSRVDPPID